jgi:glycosyltransferase involved in cell wall biosynthesis
LPPNPDAAITNTCRPEIIDMKILLASHLFFPDHRAGTEVLVLELAKSLRARGHEISIVTCSRHNEVDDTNDPWLSKDLYDAFDVFRIHFGIRNGKRSAAHHINSPKRIDLLRMVISETTPDLVHFHHINGFSAAAVSEVRKSGLPVFFTATDFWTICSRTSLYIPHQNAVCSGPESPAKCLACARPELPAWVSSAAIAMTGQTIAKLSDTASQIYSAKMRLTDITRHINTANGIFAATKFQADMLTRYGVSGQHMQVIPFGVKLGELPARAEIPAVPNPDSPLKLVFIGSLTHIKGAHVLLEALEKLPLEKLRCLDIGIYGKTRDDDVHYNSLLKDHAARLHGCVNFRGTFPHEQIGSILRNADLCVVPSLWYENAPLVLCSAVAAGTPVIVSNFGGMTEVIREGVNGLQFTADNPDELAKILIDQIDNTAWLKNAASNHSSTYRTPDDYCNDIEAAYFSMTNSDSDRLS